MNAERLLDVYEQISEAPDAIARLRRFVLDLAVRGKLVEQDAADEPAARLAQRVEERKAEILKETGMRKPRKVAEMDPAEIWADLPASWTWTQISNLGFISPRNEADVDAEASFVPMPMIFAGYGVANDHEVRPWKEIKKGYTHFAEGDVGLAKITPCFENGKSTVFRNLTGGFGSGTTELHILRPVLVDPDYVVLFLKSPQFIETGIPKMTGTAGQKRVSSEYFTSSPFPLPPLAEQQRIVAKVDELMALCDRLEEARKTREEVRDKLSAASLARLTAPDASAEDFPTHAAFALEALPALTTRPDQIKTLRQTILNLAVRGKLVEQDPADEPASMLLKRIMVEKAERAAAGLLRAQKPLEQVELNEREFDLPDNWIWVRLGEVVKLWNGLAFKSSDFGAAGIPVIRIGDLKDGAVDISNAARISEKIASQASQDIWIPNGALLLAMSGATTGKTAFNTTGQRLLLNQRVGRIEPFQVNIHFIRFFFETIIARNLNISLGTAIPNLSAKQINETPIPLPPLAEQHRIVAKVDALMALCDRLEDALTTTDTTRTRLLEALLHEALEPATDTLEAAE